MVSVEIRAGAGTTRRVWLPMRATANGATREFSVSRGNSRTKRGEVNWCRVDCFCVADWKARIPPSGNFLNRGEEERSICLRFCPSSLFENVCCCARCCLPRMGGGLDCLVNGAERRSFSTGSSVKRGKRARVARVLCTRVAHEGDPSRFPRNAKGYSSSSTSSSRGSSVIRLEFCPPTSKAGRKMGAFTLSSRVNSRH